MRKKPHTEVWFTGLSTGFCGCASTFGGLIYSAAYRFVNDLVCSHSCFFMVVVEAVLSLSPVYGDDHPGSGEFT